jgi:hypothetical protein
MAGAVGPRKGQHRAPVSLSHDEVLAVVGYRSALRMFRAATEHERRTVDENRSETSLRMAHARTTACVDALSKALATLNATLEEV